MRIYQIRRVAKRDNLCTLSLFALKLWPFRLKYVLKFRKRRQISRGWLILGPRGRAKSAKAPPPRLKRPANTTRLPGGGWAQLELTMHDM